MFDRSIISFVYFGSPLVPCLRRASSMEEEYDAAGGEFLLGNDDDDDGDGWLATHGMPKGERDSFIGIGHGP